MRIKSGGLRTKTREDRLNQTVNLKDKVEASNISNAIPKKKSGWLEIFAWVCALVAFFPALIWLFRGAVESQQLRDALVIMTSAALVIAIELRIKPHRPAFAKHSLVFLALSYAAFFTAPLFVEVWGGVFSALIIITGLISAIMSLSFACFDRRRYVWALGISFYVFAMLSFLARLFDMPLRVFAGVVSEHILKFFNKSVLLMKFQYDTPQIGLQVDGATYLVATECNGFGIISSSIVLAVILSFFRVKASILSRLGAILLSVFVAFAANALRIVSIVLTAPLFDKSKYMIIHEFYGYFFFAMALIAVWLVSKRGISKGVALDSVPN